MDDVSVAASSTGRLRIKGRVGVIATRQPVALMAQRERVVSLQADTCGCLQTRNTRAFPEPKAEDSTQDLFLEGKGREGEGGLRTGGFQKQAPRRRPTTQKRKGAEWLGSWWRWLPAHANLRSVSGGQHAGITWEDLTRDV